MNLLDDSDSEADEPKRQTKKPEKKKQTLGDGKATSAKGKQDDGLRINRKYAEKFEETARYNELQRLKSKQLDEDESDSDASSEDEGADLLSSAVDLQIAKTINSIKRRDPTIYDNSKVWFESPPSDEDDDDDDDGNDAADGQPKHVKQTYKDVIRTQLLAAADGDGDADAGTGATAPTSSARFAYDKEQEKLRQAFISSAANDSDEEDDDGLLNVKTKTPQELREEEKLLQQELEVMAELTKKALEKQAKSAAKKAETQEAKDKKGAKGEKAAVAPTTSSSSSATAGANTDAMTDAEKEAFLLDFVSQKKWQPKVNYSSREYSGYGANDIDYDLDEEDDQLDLEEAFESKYNFRFEEIGDSNSADTGSGRVLGSLVSAGSVLGHARDVPNSLRREDDSRRLARQAREEAKARERRIKEEELKRLKNLKRHELQQRLSKIAAVGGLSTEDLKELGPSETDANTKSKSKKDKGKDKKSKAKAAVSIEALGLDDEWDPAAYDKIMAQHYNDDYYNEEDEDFNAEAEDEMLAELDADDDMDYGEDEDGYADADYEQDQEEFEAAGAKAGKPTKAKTKALKAYLEAQRDAEDELYRLDYEDIVAGIPCRFKYTQVEANSFGLDAAEILLADDKELNGFVSLRKLSAYREDPSSSVSGKNASQGGAMSNSGYGGGEAGQDDKLSKKRKRLRAALRERLRQEVEDGARAGKSVKGAGSAVKRIGGDDGAASNEGDWKGEERSSVVDKQSGEQGGNGGEKKKRKRLRKPKPESDDNTGKTSGSVRGIAGSASSKSGKKKGKGESSNDRLALYS